MSRSTRNIIFIICFLFGILSSVFVFAEVPPEKLQEQIKLLQAQIQTLQADLRELQVKQTAAPTAIKPENKDLLSPDGFARELMRGSAGEDVKQLQVILQQFSNVYPEKIVSGYYGALTEKAVRRFQKEYGLPSVGRVGPKTQAVLNQLLSRLTIPEPKLSSMDAAVTELPKAFEPTPAVTPMPKTEAELKAKLDLESKAEPTALPAPTLTGTPVATSTSLATPTPIAVPTPALKSAPEKTLPAAPTPYFTYSWQASSTSYLGEIYLPTPAPKPIIVLDGKPTTLLNTDAAVRLAQVYNIVLVDNEESWDESTAGMLFEMFRRVEDIWTGVGSNNIQWRVILTDKELPRDFEILPYGPSDNVRQVRLAKSAFVFSNPMLQPEDAGLERVFYSNRLFLAVLKTFLNDKYFLQNILKTRYGYNTGAADPPEDFQEFTAEELQYIISVLEDLPIGFRNISGLNKIVRRKSGLSNPLCPNCAALARNDYIEFSDKTFRNQSDITIQQVIAHELSHFLWKKIFSQETRDEFAALSGWSLEDALGAVPANSSTVPDHPEMLYNSPYQPGWFRKTSTNFVSAYAAYKNPEEDFAETVAYYVYQPDWVRTIAPEKYNFLKRVTKGYEYVILVKEQYTFQVFNLEPDITFPGKIISVDIQVSKESNGDNKIIATLQLAKVGEGAAFARTSLSPPSGTQQSVYLSFQPFQGDPYTLRAETTINRFAERGYWMPRQISVHDRVNNQRYELQNQFGWLLFIDNSEEDLEPPIADITRVRSEISVNDLDEYIIKVMVPLEDNKSGFSSGYAEFNQSETGQHVYSYAEYDKTTQIATFTFTIRKYNASGVWVLRQLSFTDVARNGKTYRLGEQEISHGIKTANPDYAKPKIDIDSIRIKATPKHPEAPDGETDVTVWYSAWDDNSGIKRVNLDFLKPTGGSLGQGQSGREEFSKPYWPGNASEPKTYQVDFTLPVGSPPGTWILRMITIQDKAGNTITYNFTELGILRPFDIK